MNALVRMYVLTESVGLYGIAFVTSDPFNSSFAKLSKGGERWNRGQTVFSPNSRGGKYVLGSIFDLIQLEYEFLLAI